MSARGLARFTSRGAASAPPAPPDAPPSAPPGASGGPAAVPDGAPLTRFVRARTPPSPGESCDMCAQPVPEEHRHAVDLERRSLLCVCQGCSLLFMDVEDGRYRTIPDRFVRVAPFVVPPQAWTSLQIPVGMAFVVAVSRLGRAVAFYPSPAGATESELPLDAWNEVVAANPGLAGVAADVEAVLLRTTTDTRECFVVPVDRCYQLVGVLRLHWRGFDGGQEVRAHIDGFFDDIAARSRTVGESGR